MKNLISQKSIGPKELCKRMAKDKAAIDEEVAELYKNISKETGSKGIRTEDDALVDKILLNFSEIVCMELHQNSQADGPISFVMDYLVKNKIPASYTEKFIFGFKKIIAPYLQKEFSERYYAYFTAQKLIDEALRRIWTKAMDRYYHFTIGAIEESEKWHRTLFESSRDAIMTLEPPSWVFTSGNPATVEMFRTKDEKTFTSLGPWEVSPKYQPDGQLSNLKAKKMIMKAMKEGSNFFEWTHKRMGGEDFPATVLLTRVKLGGKTFLQATVRDVTRQKQMEEKLVEKEQMLENITQGIGEGIMLLSTDLRIIWANRTVCKQTGLSQKDVIGNYCYRITHHRSTPCRPPKDPCPVQDFMKTKTPVRMVHTHTNKDGKKLSVEVTVYPVRDERGKIINFVHITRDITERKKAEEMLRESEEKYRTLLENLPQKIFLKDRNFVYISCNENYAKDLKIRPEQIKGRTDYEFYPNNLAEKYRDDDRKVMKAGKIKDIEEEYIRDGKKMFVHTVKTPVKDSNGSVVGILGIFWDITETKRIENALRESEEKFRSIFENAGDGILVADLEKKKFLMANRKICKMLGYSREELLKLDVSKIHPKKDLPHVVRAFKMQAQKKMNVARGLPVLRKDGTVFYADISSGPFVLKGKRYLLGFFRYVTEKG
jgi:PAS domain S-box-containing protein